MTHRTPVTARLYPGLTYDDAPAAIDWLCRVFGFTQRLVVPGPDGSVMHAELSLGDAVVLVGSPRPEERRFGPRTVGGFSALVSVYVEDPDAHHDHAVAQGAKVVRPLEDAEHGSRGYSVEDCEGRPWHFATYVPGAWWGGETDLGRDE